MEHRTIATFNSLEDVEGGIIYPARHGLKLHKMCVLYVDLEQGSLSFWLGVMLCIMVLFGVQKLGGQWTIRESRTSTTPY